MGPSWNLPAIYGAVDDVEDPEENVPSTLLMVSFHQARGLQSMRLEERKR